MSQTRLFLDTNVLVYAHDDSSQHHTGSADLLAAGLAGQFQAVLCEQNLVELYRILTNPVAMQNQPLSAAQAKALIENTYLNGLVEIFDPPDPLLHQLLDLAVQKNITSARIFDLRLAVIARSAQVNYFVTFNICDFIGISGLTPVTPQQIRLS